VPNLKYQSVFASFCSKKEDSCFLSGQGKARNFFFEKKKQKTFVNKGPF